MLPRESLYVLLSRILPWEHRHTPYPVHRAERPMASESVDVETDGEEPSPQHEAAQAQALLRYWVSPTTDLMNRPHRQAVCCML
jgi:hypothetical protein